MIVPPRMPREPKATAEIIAEMTDEIITLCKRLPDQRLAEIAEQMFREAAAQTARAAESRSRAGRVKRSKPRPARRGPDPHRPPLEDVGHGKSRARYARG
jgi:hypothetical protein